MEDFNIPRALGVLNEAISDKKLNSGDKKELLEFFDDVFKLGIKSAKVKDSGIINLFNSRDEFRKNKDWSKSDEIREELSLKGYIVLDDLEKSYIYQKN